MAGPWNVYELQMKNALTHRRLKSCLKLVLLIAVPVAGWSQTAPDFSGSWEQDNDRCQPKRSGDVTLRIEHHEPAFIVETSISRGGEIPRHAVQKYTTDGKVSVSTGADGDEFYTAIVWNDSNLVFSIEEHEDGRILRSSETWSLIEGGATLQRTRYRTDGGKQIFLYRRQQLEAGQP
jgi:hypothetical protein